MWIDRERPLQLAFEAALKDATWSPLRSDRAVFPKFVLPKSLWLASQDACSVPDQQADLYDKT